MNVNSERGNFLANLFSQFTGDCPFLPFGYTVLHLRILFVRV